MSDLLLRLTYRHPWRRTRRPPPATWPTGQHNIAGSVSLHQLRSQAQVHMHTCSPPWWPAVQGVPSTDANRLGSRALQCCTALGQPRAAVVSDGSARGLRHSGCMQPAQRFCGLTNPWAKCSASCGWLQPERLHSTLHPHPLQGHSLLHIRHLRLLCQTAKAASRPAPFFLHPEVERNMHMLHACSDWPYIFEKPGRCSSTTNRFTAHPLRPAHTAGASLDSTVPWHWASTPWS